MGWRNNDWKPYKPRPKMAKLSAEELGRLHDTASRFVARSKVLSAIVARVDLTRGRLYFWRDETDRIARITPLSSETFLLEAECGTSWSEHARGTLRVVLGALERDRFGDFHGLGALVGKSKPGDSTVIATLHDTYGIPLAVVAEPREWYALQRQPKIVEHDAERVRVLVRFTAIGHIGSFDGTCLYARRDDAWGCYPVKPSASDRVKPSASASIASAEAWLAKRSWQEW